ncbi:DENN (AEX3) domain containing protein [Acanthamoeba castellanii str. Neff]|uniref:DENN (AEX3) domain containing protein n=1 Tax=Acanthamoeba castellanii (strain ATCC 30010 / Neff) TaxID=1257118 RepID=L8HI74_ACACF|nr:DENN (AEX3) domain containing protein [Acanthamoeba castellanii str. Neff]ELR25289.1 DENN (AEX3) domain containing protein [Acanthamoeba castellanii str. Neff]
MSSIDQRPKSNTLVEQRRQAAVRKIQAKRDFLNEAVRPSRKGHLFEHFIVVGWPPSVRVNPKVPPQQQLAAPTILYKAQEDSKRSSLVEDAVVHFCFPNKPWIQPRSTAKSSEKLEQKILFPIDDLSNSEHSYIFLMTGDGQFLYGVCVSQEELLSPIDKPSFMRGPAYSPPDGLSKEDLEYDMAAPRVYCFITRFPFFQLHFNMLYHLLELERKNNASATVRREQYIARKKRERSVAVAKSDGDMNSKWFSNLGSWFSKKNKGQAGSPSGTPRKSLVVPTLRVSATPPPTEEWKVTGGDESLISVPRAMRAKSVESMDAMKERLHDFHSAIGGGGSGGQTSLYSPGRSRTVTETTQTAPFRSPSSSSSSNQPAVDNNATGSGGADGGDDEQKKKASEDMIKRLQSHHAAIIQAQAKKSREKKLKTKEEYDEKIHRIIESVHHAQQPLPQQSQPNQVTPPPARLGHRRNRSDVSAIMRNTAIARESLLETIEETTEEPTTTTTPGSGGHKEGGGSRAAMTTPPTKRRSAMLTLSPGERKARRSSALIKNQSFMQQQEEEGEEDEEGETEGETEDDEAARVRQRNKVLDVLNEYYATEAKSLESFAAKLPRNRRKQGKLYVTPKGEEEKAIAEWCLPSLLRLVSLEHFTILLRALVLEFKVVVISKNLGILANVVYASPTLSVIALLRPLMWQGPFIPILPSNMDECVESPVPFIIGVQKLDADREAIVRSDCLVLDVENDALTLPSYHLPNLPKERELADKLAPWYDKIFTSERDKAKERRDHILMPSKTSKKEARATQEIMQIVQRYHEELISEVVNYAHIYAIATSVPASILPDIPATTPQRKRAAAAVPVPSPGSSKGSAIGVATPQRRHPRSAHASPASHQASPPAFGYPSWSDSQPVASTNAMISRRASTFATTAASQQQHQRPHCSSWARPLNDELISSLSQRRASLAPGTSSSLASLPPLSSIGALSIDLPRVVDVHRTRGGRSSFGGNRDLLSTMPARLIATADSMPLLPSPGSTPGSSRRPTTSAAAQTQRGGIGAAPRFLSLSTSALPGLHSVFADDSDDDGDEEEYTHRPRSFSLSALSSLTEEEKDELASTPLQLHTSSAFFLLNSARTTPTRRYRPFDAAPSRRGEDSDDECDGDEANRRAGEQPELKLTLTPMTPLFGSSLPQLSATTFLFSAHEQLEQLIALFPLNYQNFMRTFLFTQLWTVYTDELDRIFAERRSQISLDQLLKEKRSNMSKSDGALDEEEDAESDQAINFVTPRNAAKFSEEIRNLMAYEDGQLQSAQSLLQIFEKTPEEEAALDDILLHSSRRLTILSKALDSINLLLRSPSAS